MSDDDIIVVVQAHKEGKQIEYTSVCDITNTWHEMKFLMWDFYNYEYRVAPEPRKPREWWVHVSTTRDGHERIESPLWGIPMCDKCLRVREVIE